MSQFHKPSADHRAPYSLKMTKTLGVTEVFLRKILEANMSLANEELEANILRSFAETLSILTSSKVGGQVGWDPVISGENGSPVAVRDRKSEDSSESRKRLTLATKDWKGPYIYQGFAGCVKIDTHKRRKIIKSHKDWGNEHLPGKSGNDIKNHWHIHSKKQLDYNEMPSEFMLKHINTFKGEMNQYPETKNSVISGEASSNNLESSISPVFTEATDMELEVKAHSTMNWPGKNTCSEDTSLKTINGAIQYGSLKTIYGANEGDTAIYSKGYSGPS